MQLAYPQNNTRAETLRYLGAGGWQPDAASQVLLQKAEDALRAAAEKSQELTPEALKAWVTAEVERNPLLKVIYYQSVDARTMQEVAAWSDAERIQGCIAVQAGDIRLIDNIRIR